MTQGLSKALLASCVAGGEVRPLHAIGTALILSATHIVSAVALALIANNLITRTVVGAGRAPVLEYVSRGSLALLGSAALDVFEGEPKLNPRFLKLQNVLLQPHHASGTVETRKAMGQLLRDKLEAHFAGKPLLTPVL